MYEVNTLGVIIAAVAGMIIGALWYGPLFGKVWVRLSNVNPDTMDKSKMGLRYLGAFIGTLVMAYVLANVIEGFAVEEFGDALEAGCTMWFGFIAPVTLGGVLWGGKSFKLWLLDNAYYLVVLLVMAGIYVNF